MGTGKKKAIVFAFRYTNRCAPTGKQMSCRRMLFDEEMSRLTERCGIEGQEQLPFTVYFCVGYAQQSTRGLALEISSHPQVSPSFMSFSSTAYGRHMQSVRSAVRALRWAEVCHRFVLSDARIECRWSGAQTGTARAQHVLRQRLRLRHRLGFRLLLLVLLGACRSRSGSGRFLHAAACKL